MAKKTTPEKPPSRQRQALRKGTPYREGHPDTDPIHGRSYRIRARSETAQEALTRPG
jgi:hypothetical protein